MCGARERSSISRDGKTTVCCRILRTPILLQIVGKRSPPSELDFFPKRFIKRDKFF